MAASAWWYHEGGLISPGAYNQVFNGREPVGKMRSGVVRSMHSKRGSTNRV
jgi:hypothetical protein